MTPTRLAASRVLVAVELGRTTLAAEVERARTDIADSRDRGLLLELAAGALRWQAALDADLGAQSQRPIAELDAAVRATLRIGAYQLLHLDRVPVHAVVHEAVETVRQLGHPQASGFVNAVLRSLARPHASALPARPANGSDRVSALAYLSVTLSHPSWLVERWLTRHGFEAAETWCRFNNEPAEISVRPAAGVTADELAARLQAGGVTAERAGFVRDAIRLPPGSLGRLTPETRAALVVQEEGSQVVAHVVGARPGERVLDLCAAPGGKTLVLAHDMSNTGVLVASDLRPGRLALLRTTLVRGRAHAVVAAIDATSRLPFGPVFDRVLVDAPCSGLGTLRRDPDLKWSRRPEHLAGLAAVERRVLACAADAVRPGGLLVYATCSSEPEENESVVDGFLAARPDFGLVRADPGQAVIDPGRLVDARGFLRTLPFRDRLDAFFAAALRRRAAGL